MVSQLWHAHGWWRNKEVMEKARSLGYRWGSCGKGGWLYFHWKAIVLPAHIVEYIVAHEMAHLLESHHTPVCWGRVEGVMPEYQ